MVEKEKGRQKLLDERPRCGKAWNTTTSLRQAVVTHGVVPVVAIV